MALTKKQTEGIISLFVASFVNSSDELERTRLVIEFEDAFAKTIVDWRSMCRKKIEQCTLDENIVQAFDKIVS